MVNKEYISKNLPKVEDGYFWRITSSSFGIPLVALRKKVWFFSYLIDAVAVLPEKDGTYSDEQFLKVAESISRGLQRKLETRAVTDTLRGNYK